MNLVHFSSKPVIEVRSVQLYNQAPDMKPRGFWITDMDQKQNWFSWCQNENFRLENLLYRQKIILAPDAKMLVISWPGQLRAFGKKYHTQILKDTIGIHSRFYINWPEVCSQYQGILITPYLWECRLDSETLWYSGWDCASGCIWDNAAVQQLETII